jgi:hypothetical protein
MKHIPKTVLVLVLTLPNAWYVSAQGKPQIPDSDVVKKSIKAVGYEVAPWRNCCPDV